MDANEEIITLIKGYQERLDKYVAKSNEEKILYYLNKLKKLPIKTVHLETTGVGRSVNALKKLGGMVGNAAKEVVASWKMMVLAEEQAAKEAEENAEDDADSAVESDSGNSGDDLNIDEVHSSVSVHSEEETEEPVIESKLSKSRDDERREKPSKDKHHSGSHSKKKRKRKDSESEERKSKKHKSHRKHYSSESDREESHPKRKHDSESSEDEKHSKHRNDSESEEDKRHKSKKSRHRSDSAESKPKKHESSISKSKDKTARHDHKRSNSNSKSKSDKKKDDKEGKTKSHKSRSHSSSDKDKMEDKKRDKHKSTDSSRSKHHSKENEEQSKGSKASSSSSSRRSGEKKTKDKTEGNKVVKVNNEKMINGIDSGSGASFAEALGMCGPLVTPKNKKKSSPPLTAEKPQGSLALPSSSKARLEVPDLLQEPELEPLNLNIDNFLPEITPNYKPLGLPLDVTPKKLMTDDEALSRVMSNRNQKTKVYSGNKVRGKVESLFQICVRVLQDNIDALEYTGGVPFSILKPIIDRANPDQLFNLEHHNPYLMDDTNELWQLHCQKEFRTKQREEMESWREMYMRCLEEREARLSAITATIKQSQDKSLPVRTTKLAYVDSVAKPPRNIARRQVKNGIPNEQKPPKTASKLAALATAGEAGKVSVPNPGSRAMDRSGGGTSSASVKPKKAPLMAKTLSFLKNRFRR